MLKQYYTIFLKIQIVNAKGDINNHVFCWKYRLKWLETTFYMPNVKFLPFFGKCHKWQYNTLYGLKLSLRLHFSKCRFNFSRLRGFQVIDQNSQIFCGSITQEPLGLDLF